ncbi:MAG: translation initiation factor IF-3 [Clostridia bacterium]|nr:translation initiation factor IF-3 [Clostridia bacterium]MBR3715345.1 translation initiation factor IF-3 [Clostridia bacterium]
MVNEEIFEEGFAQSAQIRVIGPDGEQLGILTAISALNSAYDKGLDLVLIAPQSVPPVARIMDYGKFRFEREKKKKEAKKNQQKVEVKEVQLSCKIEQNDFNTKVNNARKFLSAGNKVKVLVVFKGRQLAHQEVGVTLIEQFEEAVADLGAAEKRPAMEGRSMTLLISPTKPAAKAQQQNNTQDKN